ncbi:MAG TPA: 3-phosphoshikimate 1-carboxyvinyltransferase [Leptospiraceae bacterium]|nr:3-phosphoshikimate 1-carboxyvinyltransferase [Leptospiraceae bacterium]HMW05202.1 3-phosphoshikimate 1-carboxyvinyltransferase [Leptospiraceae bacterium]HMX31333.1 3-phosphoshikimate 1-carboxyvinyltransferase [Leptospiraceae bacterium]HMY32139.1 3-phosphoshikimate 1-carboxyvinyltransferase [Leptospiraceae bacterium]HMZ63480.1 3-phosphoshikimate 1-carboxyvinyltransferase [Leptospiraceae bacterium]
MLVSKFNIPADFTIQVPGDKSISHRSVLFSSLAKGNSEINGFLEAEDPLNTMKSFSKLGVEFTKLGKGSYKVVSPGKLGLTSPKEELDFGNGGTGIRLSAGLLSGLVGIQTQLTGDASLRKRPMKRIIDPLSLMGADIQSLSGDGKAPLKIQGKKLISIFYKSPIASAQVKSCLMLAAISSDVGLEYEEEELSRNHTENMLQFLGGEIEFFTKTHFKMKPPFAFSGAKFQVPGDISSAAFFIVFGLLAKSGSILIQNVGLNPARTGILTVLKNMGGKIEVENERSECGEVIGDLRVYPSNLTKTEISSDLIPSIIDEIPILTIAGLFSKNGFEIRNAEDLRAKESDRIHAMVVNLRKLGIEVDEQKDGYSFEQVKEIQPALIESFMDHRIAMSFLILKTLLENDIKIDDDSWIDTSFPEFKSIVLRLKS